MAEQPLVTLGVVAYNEEEYLAELLEDIRIQSYPKNRIELLLIDSMSDDQTYAIMEDFAACHAARFSDIRLLKNPGKRQAAGWNVAIREFSGDLLVRVDAHARLGSDFVEQTVACLQSGEKVCGGRRPNLILDETPWKRTLLMAEQSLFGSSFARYRSSDKRCYVKSAFHTAYLREVLQKVGGFNESLGRTEDNEFHYRVHKAGYRICYEPKIESYQYIRPRLHRILRQKAGNGYWVARTLFFCPRCISLFHLVPFAFVTAILATALLATLVDWWLPLWLLWSAYALFAIGNAVLSVRSYRKFSPLQLTLPLLFLLLHLSYGLGSVLGFLSAPFGRKRGGHSA